MKKYLWIIGLIIFPMLVHASNAKLTSVHVETFNNDLRIHLSLDQSVKAQAFLLSNPTRLVVDFKKTRLATSLRNLNLTNTNINNIRVGYPDSSTIRMVFDLKTAVRFKLYSHQHDTQVTIDLYASNRIKSAKKPIMREERLTTSEFHPATPIVTKAPAAHRLMIVIDPGHGGHDPGATGSHGIKEKNVTLAISRRLVDLINQQPNMHAVLTRTGDYYVGLRDRLKLARKGKTDLFIALHADSYFDDSASGASVYALSQHGATSEAARWLAKRDNYSELGGVDLRELGDQSYLLRSVLIDLAQTATITDSMRLGRIILSSMHNITKLHYSRVEQAPFMVLKSPDIPSILVEMGFISNDKEELRLNSAEYQEEVAQALFNGMRIYLKKYPVVGVS